MATINANRALATQFSVLLGKIAAGHARLFAQRDHLKGKEALQMIFQDVASIQAQLNSIRALI